ncbi:MAG: hypothetical protein II765_07040, partial [Lachnospiraceae bacterium]|nr:hypothetical protein [Lachnospiraceae bacterium]
MNLVFLSGVAPHRVFHFMPGYSWGEIIYNFIAVYLIFTFFLTAYSIIRMYVLESKCTGYKYGRKRLKELQSSGRLRQIPLYT